MAEPSPFKKGDRVEWIKPDGIPGFYGQRGTVIGHRLAHLWGEVRTQVRWDSEPDDKVEYNNECCRTKMRLLNPLDLMAERLG